MEVRENQQPQNQAGSKLSDEFFVGLKFAVPDFSVQKLICPPMELATSPYEFHSMGFWLNQSTRQMNRFDGKEFYGVANPGDFVLMPAGLCGEWSTETTNMTLLSFEISANFFTHIIDTNECQNANRIELKSLPLHRDPKIKALANLFFTELESDYLGGQIALDAYKNLLGVTLLRDYFNVSTVIHPYDCRLSPHKLKQTIDYIQANLNKDLSLATMSSLVGLSEYYFCRMFKASTGISPCKYVVQCRIDRAKLLMQHKYISLADIALQVGFANQSHFNRHFKRIVGTTPKQFQHQMR